MTGNIHFESCVRCCWHLPYQPAIDPLAGQKNRLVRPSRCRASNTGRERAHTDTLGLSSRRAGSIWPFESAATWKLWGR